MTGTPRVVSLVPSVTETLLAWGVTPLACTRFCEQPALRHVGGTKDPDVPAIVDLDPDLVVLCVEENRREDAEALARAGVRTAALSIDGVDDVLPGLRMLAGLVGRDPTAVGLDDAAWTTRSPGDPGLEPLGLSAFVPVWKRPWMTLSGGTYGSSLLAS
ncbi:MAG TPA: helical backbone metal receptor, partial [Microthrixaceae bacterium]|nr:helical backbone metal receptor [Microthrixaceae bacterium]